MLPTINGKSLLDCELNDLQFILDNPDFRENEHIDYKENFSIDCYPKDKKTERQKAIEEFRSDVCAFANADGGYLFFGVKEDRKGNAHELVGINIADGNRDKFELNLKNYLQPISPRSPTYRPHFVELESGKYVVIIFVQHDYFAPYIHLADEKDYRIYKRVGNSKAVITYTELKNMFTQSLSMEKEIEHFRRERVENFCLQEDNETFDYSKFILFHLLPETFLDSTYNQPLLALERRNGSFSRIFQTVSCTGLSQPIIEGLRYRHFRNIDNTERRLYNNGIAECFLPLYPYYLQPERQGNSFFNEESVWGHIDDIIKEYASVMAPLLRIHRIYSCITICGCKKAITAFNVYNAPVGVIDRDRLTCNPIVFEDISNNESIDLDKKRLRLEYLLSLGIRVPDKINDLITEVYGE